MVTDKNSRVNMIADRNSCVTMVTDKNSRVNMVTSRNSRVTMVTGTIVETHVFPANLNRRSARPPVEEFILSFLHPPHLVIFINTGQLNGENCHY